MMRSWKAFGLLCCAAVLSCGGVSPLWGATFTVANTAASGDGSLAWAVDQANAAVGPDSIVFSLPGSSLITVAGPLSFFSPVTIDGGKSVVLAMTPADTTSTILQFLTGSAGSTIKDIALTHSYCGLYLHSGQNRVIGCAIGTDWASVAAAGNTMGVIVDGADVLIGGATAADRNLISGNGQFGVLGNGAVNLRVQGNYIGTDATGTLALGNLMGVMFWGTTTGSLIGGTRGPIGTLGEGNLLAGNIYHLQIDGHAATGNTICGNLLGVTLDQNSMLESNDGITLRATTGNWVGLPAPGQNNVICGNTISGIAIEGPTPPVRNVIQNNLIGMSETGMLFGNGIGILLGGDANLIGGDRAPASLEGNVIVGSANIGIQAYGNGNTLCGNLIGLKPDGTTAAGNLVGIALTGNGNLVGGSNSDLAHRRGNVISGQSAQPAIQQSQGSDNRILGNWIGLNTAGTAAAPNSGGLFIHNPASRRTIVGGVGGQGNVISGNSSYGVMLDSTSDHILQNNWIGLSAAGTSGLPNGGDALTLLNTSGCRVGGSGAGEGNVFNSTANGIVLTQAASSGNTVLGNWIGVLADGATPGQDLVTGVRLDSGAHDNWIGLPNGGANNLLAHTANGIVLNGSATDGNGLFGNTITAFSGAGVLLNPGANDNHAAPVIGSAILNSVAGTAAAGDTVEVFKAERGGGVSGGSLRWLGTTLADGSNNWSLSVSGLGGGDYVCALATDAARNTSPFSGNVQVLAPGTPTATPTVTPTATVSATATISTTVTATPTVTQTPTVTPVFNATAGVQAYPVPGHERITFLLETEVPAEFKVQLYNIYGEQVGEVRGAMSNSGHLVWNCRQAPPGIYLARILKDGVQVAKLKVAVAR